MRIKLIIQKCGRSLMLYRKMPKNGDELSIIGFGTMRLPTHR
jgi:hypothetical protein